MTAYPRLSRVAAYDDPPSAGAWPPHIAGPAPEMRVAGPPPAPREAADGVAPPAMAAASPVAAHRRLSRVAAHGDPPAAGAWPVHVSGPVPEMTIAGPPPASPEAADGAAPAVADATPAPTHRRLSRLAAYHEPPAFAGTSGIVRELAARDPALVEDELGLGREQGREIQRRLTLAGFGTGGVDGVFGERTRAAIRSWQEERGLAGSGYLDADQIAALAQETEHAYRSFIAAARERAKSTTAHRAPERQTRRTGREGRYLDAQGCLREADGSYVPFFKWRCQ
ncbi:MAG TPA: peptidoglycan-binding domain-containing protein [Paracoccaceae bacterium]|nr:peptidoglycan-binding domain-containing protein [Paracoccaceae bacterium]